MTGFNSQSQITVNWENTGFAKVLSEIKQIEEAAKRLNISGATKKVADGMLRNVKDTSIAQQKLAQNAERLELERLKRVDKLNKDEYNRNKDRQRELSRQYKENERNKKKELDGVKKLEDEKTKILNDAKTKQAFLRKQNATNERKEKLARDLKAIQEDRMLTKHQRNIEIAERKKAFAEYEKFVSSSRLKGAINGERIHIGRHGANSIEGINATNRRIEAENALSNKNSLLAKAGGNVSKARIASDEFNRKQSNKLEDAKRLEALSRSEFEIGTKRISQQEKDIQNAKTAVAYDKIILKQKEQEIHNNRVILKDFKEGSAQYLSIQSKITDGLIESNKIQTRINNGQLQYHDAKEAKRVHQINRDAQFYTRANVAFTAPATIGAYNAMSALKERERMDLVLIGMHGAENLKAEREKLLQVQYKSSLSLDNLIKVEQITGMYAKKEAQSGRTVNKDEVSQAMRDVLSLTTLNGRNITGAMRQLQDITRQGYALPKRDLQVLLNNVLGLDFDTVYKKLYGKFYSGDGNLTSKQVVDILIAAMKEPRALDQKEAQKSGYTMAEERLGETIHNLSGEFGKLLNETIGLTGKFNSASESIDGLRKWFAERNPDGSQKTSQKALIGAAVAVAGTLLMGLFNSHKRKAMEFFFKGDDVKFKERFATSYDTNKKAGYGKFAKPMAYVGGLGGVGRAALQFGGAAITYEGVNDLIVAKTLKDWGIASAEIIGGMTLLFGPAGIVAGIVTSLAIKTSSFLDSLENDPNSWWSKLGDFFGKDNYKYERAVGVTRKDPKTGKYIVEGAANFDDPNGRPAEAKTVEKMAAQRAKNTTAGLGNKTDAEVWDAKQKKDNEARKAKAKAYRDAEIKQSKEASEIKSSFMNAEIRKSANAAQYKKDTPVILQNYINNTATSGINVKSDIETKQIGGQSYPSL